MGREEAMRTFQSCSVSKESQSVLSRSSPSSAVSRAEGLCYSEGLVPIHRTLPSVTLVCMTILRVSLTWVGRERVADEEQAWIKRSGLSVTTLGSSSSPILTPLSTQLQNGVIPFTPQGYGEIRRD